MIVLAAIKQGDVLCTGKRHGDIFKAYPKGFFNNCTQGFLTDRCKFLTRDEALVEAVEYNQLLYTKLLGSELTSEDLW